MADTVQITPATFFTPQLFLKQVLSGMDFYQRAFGAVELRRFSNPDGSVHVAEMSIGGALFHLHEESPHKQELSPETLYATTVLIGLFVDSPDALMNHAIAAGGKVARPLQDYDYGYRQGVILDPAGHRWLIQKKI